MLQFHEMNKSSQVYPTVNKMIVFLALDTMSDNTIFRLLETKHPELKQKFTDSLAGRSKNVGDYIRVVTDSGVTIYFCIIRAVEKFQPYILDITKVLTEVVNDINASSGTGDTMFILPTSSELKISDSISVWAICDTLNKCRTSNIQIISNGDHSKYINVDTTFDLINPIANNSWKSDWMMTLDDLIFMNAVYEFKTRKPDFKLAKSNFVKCYRIASDNGMFPKIEWYNTEYGPFFKQFMQKFNSMINHGIFINELHYENHGTEPQKFKMIVGPYASHLFSISRVNLIEKRDLIEKIISDINIIYEEQKASMSKRSTNQYNAPKEVMITL